MFVDDKANSGWVLFYWKLMLPWMMGVRFENTCTVSGKWNVIRVVPRLYRWYIKFSGSFPLLVELQVPIWETSKQRVLCVTNFWFPFSEICVQNQWWYRILRFLRDSNTSAPSWIAVKVMVMFMVRECLLLYDSGIVNFVWKTNEGGDRNYYCVNFCFGGFLILCE